MFYSNNVIKTFLEFDNTGIIKGSDATSKVVDKDNGEIYKIYTKIENGKIIDVKFQAFGSALVFASLSTAVSMINGKSANELRKITVKDLIDKVGEYPMSREYVLYYTIDTIKKLANEIDEFTGRNKQKKEVKKPSSVASKNNEKEQSENIEVIEPVVIEKKISAPKKKVSTTKIITITHGDEDNIKAVTVENHDKMTAEDIKEIIDSKINSTDDVKQLNITEEKVEVKDDEPKVIGKKKHVKKDSLLGDDDEDDVQNEIDDITAKLTEAIANLNFKFDDSEE